MLLNIKDRFGNVGIYGMIIYLQDVYGASHGSG
jgi:hypothetical protein